MLLTCLSNKGSFAPVAYIILQTVSLVCFAIFCPVIGDFNEYPQMAIFWLNVFITIVLYFVTHLKDPGFVPVDAGTLVELQIPGSDVKRKKRIRVDSLEKHKRTTSSAVGLKSDSFASNGYDARVKFELQKGYLRKITEENHGASLFTTNGAMVTNLNTEVGTQPEKKSISLISVYTNNFKDSSPSRNDIQTFDNQEVDEKTDDCNNAAENRPEEGDEARDDEDIVACEPSMDVNDESIQNVGEMNFNLSKADVDSTGNPGTPVKFKNTSPKSIKNQNILRDENKSINLDDQKSDEADEKRHNRSSESRNSRDKEKRSSIPEFGDHREHHHQQILNKGLAVSKQIVCSIVAFPREEEEGEGGDEGLVEETKSKRSTDRKSSKQSKYHKFEDEDRELHGGAGNMNILGIELKKMIQSSDNFEQVKQPTERQLIKSENDGNSSHRYILSPNLRESKLSSSHMIESSKAEDLEQQRGLEPLYVERRYCTKCNVEQPLRAKHCKDCGRCVGQYDHHCPWLGTCIGEKNHLSFYWFLIFQVFEYMFSSEYSDWAYENTGRIILALFFTFFFLMIASLLCFHTYLAMVNLTTWESLSWYKISYLKEWQEDWGSPFSQGCCLNLKFFCCSSKAELKDWEMPQYKRQSEYQDF